MTNMLKTIYPIKLHFVGGMGAGRKERGYIITTFCEGVINCSTFQPASLKAIVLI